MRIYPVYMLVIFILNLLIWITPVLEMSQDPLADILFSAFSPLCHQLPSRSLCVSGDSIVDCIAASDFQFPVCSRDVAIYGAMFIGGLVLPFLYDPNNRKTPNVLWLIAAAIPIAIDGGTQLIGVRESTNLFRIITGAIVGFAIPFFLIPLVNDLMYVLSEKKQSKKKRK